MNWRSIFSFKNPISQTLCLPYMSPHRAVWIRHADNVKQLIRVYIYIYIIHIYIITLSENRNTVNRQLKNITFRFTTTTFTFTTIISTAATTILSVGQNTRTLICLTCRSDKVDRETSMRGCGCDRMRNFRLCLRTVSKCG